MSGLQFELSEKDITRLADALAARLAKQPKAELLTPAQAALRLAMTEKALERRRYRGQLPEFVKRGARIFYTAREIEQFIASRHL